MIELRVTYDLHGRPTSLPHFEEDGETLEFWQAQSGFYVPKESAPCVTALVANYCATQLGRPGWCRLRLLVDSVGPIARPEFVAQDGSLVGTEYIAAHGFTVPPDQAAYVAGVLNSFFLMAQVKRGTEPREGI